VRPLAYLDRIHDDASPQPSIIIGVNNAGVTPESVVYAPDLIGVYIMTFEVLAIRRPAPISTSPSPRF
jgi:hypothetical protein